MKIRYFTKLQIHQMNMPMILKNTFLQTTKSRKYENLPISQSVNMYNCSVQQIRSRTDHEEPLLNAGWWLILATSPVPFRPFGLPCLYGLINLLNWFSSNFSTYNVNIHFFSVVDPDPELFPGSGIMVLDTARRTKQIN